MPSLTFQQLIDIVPAFNDFPIFVETGTHMGNTIFAMEPYFQELHTIEIKEEFYDIVKNSYKGSKINFYLGDSITELNQIVEKLNGNAIFFLDGHWSSGDTGRGEKDVPLLEELKQIMENFKYSAIVIIDDLRLFGSCPEHESCNEDWSEISEGVIKEICQSRSERIYSLDDRLIIHLNENIID